MFAARCRSAWGRVQSSRWFVRWPIKWAAVVLAAFFVSWPNPAVFARHLRHARQPNAMVDPGLPELQPWVNEVKERLEPTMDSRQALRVVQRFVYEKVPYKYDWETWGCADYLPTLSEVMDLGSEDCDGQAVVAASLLRNLGYKAELVSNVTHVWVKTDKGETMSPGKQSSLVATDRGYRANWAVLLRSIPRATGLGIALFPLMRELIVLAVVWLVLLRPGVGWPVRLLCLLLLLDGLLLIRAGGANWGRPDTVAQLWGVAHLGGALLVMLIAGRRAAGASGIALVELPGGSPPPTTGPGDGD